MKIELSKSQEEHQAKFREFASQEVAPNAKRFDQEQVIPDVFITKLAAEGYLGAILPQEYGGRNMDMITYGLLNQELGRACTSVRSLVMIQNMIAQSIFKWGNRRQKATWLEKISSGESIAAFALTEPDVGSDAKNIKTAADLRGDHFILNGRKKWISLGQIADVILTFAQYDGKLCAFLVEKDTPGMSIEPIRNMLGVRASMLAEIDFHNCTIPETSLVGGIGFGFVPVGLIALNIGRYSIAWGCVGIAQACLEACLNHTATRKQFGVFLKDHQLIKKKIADMLVNIKAARLLCYQAGCAEELGGPDSVMQTMIAKYFATTMAVKVANNAVQIHGAIGCSDTAAVERHMRDAKIMEIIEGTSEIHQLKIAELGYQEFGQRETL